MFQKVILYISGSAVRIAIFFGLSIVCFALIATNPTHIKNMIDDSNIYDKLVTAVIHDTIKQNNDSTLPLQDKSVQEAITSSFTPTSLQSNSESMIDEIYKWLDGSSTTPEIDVDFTSERQQASDKISSLTFDRIRVLPLCFATPETFDPFTVGCQPPSSDLGTEQIKLGNTLAGESGILPKATYSKEDLPRNNQGLYIYERYDYSPVVYRWLKLSPYIVGLMLITFCALVVRFSNSRREGFLRLGTIIVGSGVALIFTPILLSFVLPSITKSLSFSSQSDTGVNSLSNTLVNNITNNFYGLLLNVSLQVIVVGLVILLAERLTRPTSRYSDVKKSSGMVSSHTKRPSTNKKYKPVNIPLQSSEESTRRKPKKTRNKKYRKIPGKGAAKK